MKVRCVSVLFVIDVAGTVDLAEFGGRVRARKQLLHGVAVNLL
jgi:hypothetical protein